MMKNKNLQLPNTELWEKLLSNENLKADFSKVKKNSESTGIDKMNVCE